MNLNAEPGILQKLADPAADTFGVALLAQVLAVEQAAAQLPGATKAEIVMATTAASLQAAGQVVPPGKIQTGIAQASMIVSLLNAFGFFKKKAKAA